MNMDRPEFEQLLQRIDRSFDQTSLSEVISSRKAIIGPRADLLEKDAREARELLLNGKTPTARQLAALEQVIRLQRPVPCCVANGLTPLPEGGNWLQAQWTAFQPVLQRLQGSIARLERIDDPSPSVTTGRTILGTGFLVAADVLLTALHVVDALSFGTRRLERGQAMADFSGYFGVGGRDLHEVIEIVDFDPSLDLALIRITPVEINDSRPILLPGKLAATVGQPVCVVGYPLDDPRNARALISILFENRFGVKRAALGEITTAHSDFIGHDCSTLGGNSGAPVIDLASGQVCGVHVSGEMMVRNEAIPGQLASNFVQRALSLSNSAAAEDASETKRRKSSLLVSDQSTSRRTRTTKLPNARSQTSKRSIAMAQRPSGSFADYYKRLQENDEAVCNEITHQLTERAVTESADSTGRQFQLETIVLRKGRPVLDIKGGATVIDIAEVESQIWKQRLNDANTLIKPNIPAVGRIELHNHPRGISWLGTGWVIRDNIIVTNRHVANEFGDLSGGRFIFRPGFDGSSMLANIDFLEEFENASSQEFPLFEIMHIESGGGPDLAFLRIEPVAGQNMPAAVTISSESVQPGEQVAVIGYPARDPFFSDQDLMKQIFNDRYDKKRLAPGLVTGKNADRVFHDCSTLGGNSGGEIISLNTGHAVALHFAGTLFTTNHAVPIDIVASRLDKVLAGRGSHIIQPASVSTGEIINLQSTTSTVATSRIIEATIPIKVRIELGDVVTAQPPNATGSTAASAPSSQPTAAVVVADEDLIESTESRPEDYTDREGYDPLFLGEGFEVPLPELTEDIDDILEFDFDGATQSVLYYEHFSVQMSVRRRMCRFSACNIDGLHSRKKKRTGWQFDPRIPKAAQIMKECYGNEPKFSRGHMTRREDPVWGTDAEAVLGNSDSMHVTNAVPQMQPFNAGIWLSLEDYALDNAREDQMRICVFTGPFLEKNDPFRYDVKIPVNFWKVIAFIHDETGKLCATGYTMSQKSFLKEEEFVFTQHEHHQRPIAEIERRAGISFGPLAKLDPMRDSNESTPTMLTSPQQIRFV